MPLSSPFETYLGTLLFASSDLYAGETLILWDNESVANDPYLFNPNFNNIPVFEPHWRTPGSSDAAGCPCHDDGTRSEGVASTHETDDCSHTEEQVIRPCVLSDFSVDLCRESQIGSIRHCFRRCNDRSQGAELVKGLRVAGLRAGPFRCLPVSRRDIVSYRITQYIVERVFVLAQVQGCFANDGAQFTLEPTDQPKEPFKLPIRSWRARFRTS